jgi:hypothetical protein
MALILANATPNSLIIIDELGRGTSNQDGVGIAWACCENLLSLRAPTLFATHFSELVQLANIYPNCQNLHLGVEPRQDGLHFLYRCYVCARTRASAALVRALVRASLARSPLCFLTCMPYAACRREWPRSARMACMQQRAPPSQARLLMKPAVSVGFLRPTSQGSPGASLCKHF